MGSVNHKNTVRKSSHVSVNLILSTGNVCCSSGLGKKFYEILERKSTCCLHRKSPNDYNKINHAGRPGLPPCPCMAIGKNFPIEPVSGIILQRQHFAFFLENLSTVCSPMF